MGRPRARVNRRRHRQDERRENRQETPARPLRHGQKLAAKDGRLKPFILRTRPVSHNAPVAQLDRVPGFEPGGRGFESLRARQRFQLVTKRPRVVQRRIRKTIPKTFTDGSLPRRVHGFDFSVIHRDHSERFISRRFCLIALEVLDTFCLNVVKGERSDPRFSYSLFHDYLPSARERTLADFLSLPVVKQVGSAFRPRETP